jgi:hypothetical protein
MDDFAKNEFLKGVAPRFVPLVAAIADCIGRAVPEMQPFISYRMLMYTPGTNRRDWVCAIGVTKTKVCLRFLFGSSLSDTRGVLRPGTSTLSTIDFNAFEEFDEQLVADYVTEAAAQHGAASTSRSGKRQVAKRPAPVRRRHSPGPV